MADSASLYKTPDAYLLVMIDRIRQLGSKITDFSVGSGTRSFFEAQASGLSEQSGVAEQLRQDSYLATATGDALDRKALDNQVERVAAVAATGTVTITRAAAGAAVTIPAGWSQLLTVAAPGQQSIAFATTADAVFAPADTSKTVAAAAVVGGVSGNIANATRLLPTNPVSGFQVDGGFAAGSAFINGVDAESDDALRTRVPIEVAGRVKGRLEAFQAAALRIAGVESVNVLRAGDARGDATTVPGGFVEVYWEGSSGLTGAVNQAAADAAVMNQTATAIAAAAERIIASLTVYCRAGVDTAALATAVRATVKTVVNGVPVGGIVRASAVIEAVHALAEVVSVTVPLADLRKASAAVGTFGDIVNLPIRYPSLADADCTVAVVTLS